MWINKIALVKITGEVEHIGKLCFECVAEKSFGSVLKERKSEWVTKMRVDDFLKVNVVDNFKCSKSLRLALRAFTREKCF